MSGGHFEYKDSYALDVVIDQLEIDIKFNDLKYTESNDYEEQPYGYQHSEATLIKVKEMLEQCKTLKHNLHEYDWYVSGDTCEETFNKEYTHDEKLKRKGD